MLFGQDCVEYKDSLIEVKKCYIDDITRTIFIEIVPGLGLYTN
jgi:hypothetical protein